MIVITMITANVSGLTHVVPAVFEHWLEHACPKDFQHLDPGSLGFLLKDMLQSCTRKVGTGKEVSAAQHPTLL